MYGPLAIILMAFFLPKRSAPPHPASLLNNVFLEILPGLAPLFFYTVGASHLCLPFCGSPLGELVSLVFLSTSFLMDPLAGDLPPPSFSAQLCGSSCFFDFLGFWNWAPSRFGRRPPPILLFVPFDPSDRFVPFLLFCPLYFFLPQAHSKYFSIGSWTLRRFIVPR